MKKKDIYTLIALIVLTFTSALFSYFEGSLRFLALIILILSSIKFLLVFFRFMEMKKANTFWKVIIISYLIIFTTIVSVTLTT